MNSSHKTVLITGAASGIGRLYAEKYSALGTKVAAFDINKDGLDTLTQANNNITAYAVDMTDTQAVNTSVQQAFEHFSGFDRVINAAAIMPCGTLMNHATESILQVMTINYGGLVNLTKAVMPYLLKQDKAEFIVFSSMLGIMPTLKTGAYSASKFATSAFTEILAEEHRNTNIQFACICPPAVKTPLLDQVRATEWPKIMDDTPPITPEDVIEAIEKGMKKKNFWIFPGKGTKIGAIMRRLFPQLVWKHIQQVENKA